MTQDVYLYERLVVGIDGEPVREGDGTADTLSLRLWFKNPLGSPGSTRRPPAMELWIDDGRAFDASNDDWAMPILEDTETTRVVRFRIPPGATPVELVLGPGEPDEVHIPLQAAAQP